MLLCSLGEEVFAYHDACPRSILPLHLGSLQGNVLRCPWHGCLYDVRTGRRLDREGPGLVAFQVIVRDGVVRVAITGSRVPAPVGGPRG